MNHESYKLSGYLCSFNDFLGRETLWGQVPTQDIITTNQLAFHLHSRIQATYHLSHSAVTSQTKQLSYHGKQAQRSDCEPRQSIGQKSLKAMLLAKHWADFLPLHILNMYSDRRCRSCIAQDRQSPFVTRLKTRVLS